MGLLLFVDKVDKLICIGIYALTGLWMLGLAYGRMSGISH
jgi:hypothetical protein